MELVNVQVEDSAACRLQRMPVPYYIFTMLSEGKLRLPAFPSETVSMADVFKGVLNALKLAKGAWLTDLIERLWPDAIGRDA